MTEEITWQQFLNEAIELAAQNHIGYHIYEAKGVYRLISDEKYAGYTTFAPAGRSIAYVYGDPIVDERGKVLALYEVTNQDVHFHSDKKVRRGAPDGNSNAAKGKYPRRVLSHVGPEFDLVMDHLKEQENADPSNDEVLDEMNSAFRSRYGES